MALRTEIGKLYYYIPTTPPRKPNPVYTPEVCKTSPWERWKERTRRHTERRMDLFVADVPVQELLS